MGSPRISGDPSGTPPPRPPAAAAPPKPDWDPASPRLPVLEHPLQVQGFPSLLLRRKGTLPSLSRPWELPLKSTWGGVHDREGRHRGGLASRTGLQAGPQGSENSARNRGVKRRPGVGEGPAAPGAPRTAKLSPPPEVWGAEKTASGEATRRLRGPPDSWSRKGRLRGGPRRPRARRPRPPHLCPRPARTHLAVELADRHDPAGRAGPGAPCPADCPRSCPDGRRVPAPRCPGGAQSAARPPGAIFLG